LIEKREEKGRIAYRLDEEKRKKPPNLEEV